MKGLKIIFFHLLVFGLVIACAHGVAGSFPLSYGSIGTRDGYQYWAALQALLGGKNPFDPSNLIPVDRGSGYQNAQLPMMRNPPWTAVFMMPWMLGTFSEAIWSWRFVQLLLGVYIWWALTPRTAGIAQRLSGALLLLCFYPIADSYHSGQLGLLLALAVALFLRWSGEKEQPRDVLFISILLIKPHLFLPVFSYVLSKGRWRTLVFSLVLNVSVCVAIFGSQSIYDWVQSMVNPVHPELRTSLADFRSDTLSAWIRELLLNSGHGRGDYLIGVFSLTSLVTGWIVARRSRGFDMDGPLLIVMSLLLAPYGWMSDYAILGPLLLSPRAALADPNRRVVVIVWALLLSVSLLVIPAVLSTLTWLMVVFVYGALSVSPKHSPIQK
jgi:hypothetical protein